MDLPQLKRRAANSHKGDYGRVLVIGGSVGMSGSVSMAGKACLRSGAGLVTIATPRDCLAVVAAYEPSVMTRPLDCDAQGRVHEDSLEAIDDLLQTADCVALGPGLGRGPAVDRFVSQLYGNVTAPMVIDADALNGLAAQRKELATPPGPRILTPHPGEFRRMIGQSAESRSEQEDQAREFAEQIGCVLVLKGHQTLITDGKREAINLTGNPGMATGGSGDILTGVIAGLVGQGYSCWDASVLGCHIHGLAGDMAAHRLGQISMIASDMIDFLPAAFLKLDNSATETPK